MPPAQVPEQGQQMELTDAGRERARPEPDAPAPRTVPLPSLDPRDSAFAARRLEAAPVYPVDSRIGSLRLGGLAGPEQLAWEAALDLLEAIVAGDVTAGADARRSVRAGIEAIASAASGDEPRSVRLAAPIAGSEDEFLFAFRVLSPDVDVTGELVLETDASGWYIADIQSGSWSRPDG